MTQAEIARRLHRLHFSGKWSKSKLAEICGLSRPTIDSAMEGVMSAVVQSRIMNALKSIPENAPPKKKGLGKRRRYLMRLFNLKKWIADVEHYSGLRKFKDHRYKNLTKEEAGYVCTKLDYRLKWYLLEIFGPKLKEKKATMGDCYSAEQWIKKLAVMFPREQEPMMKELLRRGR